MTASPSPDPWWDLPDPGARAFEKNGERGFAVRSAGVTAAFLDRCPHAGASLSNGTDRYLTRDGRRILCLQHGALFTLEGLCVAGPCAGRRLTPWPAPADPAA